jgi:hypothetical protein
MPLGRSGQASLARDPPLSLVTHRLPVEALGLTGNRQLGPTRDLLGPGRSRVFVLRPVQTRENLGRQLSSLALIEQRGLCQQFFDLG